VQDVDGTLVAEVRPAPESERFAVSDALRAVIGRSRHDLITPALVLDLDVARRNIATMAQRMAALPAKLRPHVKVHKSPTLARMQIEAGAIGVATATVWEAQVMARSGIADILVANQVVGKDKIAALAEAARLATLSVAVDDVGNLDALSAAARAAGSTIGVLVEIDVGMGRAGARSADEARRLAAHASRLPGLQLLGVMGYEGHCMSEPDREVRGAKARAAMDYLLSVVDTLAATGFASQIVSAGGTGTYDVTGANPRVTEIQAGSYIFMDAFHGRLVPDFAVALTVAATVLSRHGDAIVLDAGRKAVGADLTMPRLAGHEGSLAFLHEEHSGFSVAPDCPLRVGDTVELVAGYGPTTVNMYEAYNVVSDGVVVDVWPVPARGYGRLLRDGG
jgi:D-serine deaminase-like pyridoxal phosphate-dependent protein